MWNIFEMGSIDYKIPGKKRLVLVIIQIAQGYDHFPNGMTT